MRNIREWLHRVRSLVGGGRADADLQEELRTHLELASEEATRRGHSAAEAERLARIAGGGGVHAIEAMRDQRGLPLIEDMFQDVRHALRTLRRAPAFTVVALLTLAVGLGATATAFSLAYGVLLRPLPFPDADRLVWVTTYDAKTSNGREFVDNSNRMSQFLDWREHLTSFDRLAAWSGTSSPDVYTVTGAGAPERVNGLRVTQQLLPLFGARTATGSLFTDSDDRVGAEPRVLLSYGYWQRRFGGRTDIVGQLINVENEAHTIAGVVSADFPLPAALFRGAPIELYLPLTLDPETDNWGYFMTVVGRLRPGAAIDRARSELQARQVALAVGRPHMANRAQHVTPLAEPVAASARTPVLLLLGGIACVLLLACANLANLLLVRASGRRREIQLRAALGAGTGRILRQMVTEAAVVVFAGGAAGLAVATVLTRLLRSGLWLDLPRLAEFESGWPAIIFTLLVCGATTVAFGCIPLLYVRDQNLFGGLRPHIGVTSERRAVYVQRVALSAQVALALVLTVASSLLFRSLIGLMNVDPGFTPDRTIALRVDPAGRLAPAGRVPFFNQVLANVSSLPGVQSAAIAINLPMDRNMGWDVMLPDQQPNAPENAAFARIVSPAYFRTMGIRIVRGREFTTADQLSAPQVMAINETLARRVASAGTEPLGATLVVNGRPRVVVAIVGDVKHQNLRSDAGREFYLPHTQAPGWEAFDLVLRSADPRATIPATQEAIWRIDRNQAIGAPVELQGLIDRTLRPLRALSWLLGAFAAAALFLASLGVYGVVSYHVAELARDLAIRVALGAPPRHVVSSVVRDARRSIGFGALVGLPLSLAGASWVREYLYGVDATDVVTLIGACAVLAVSAAVAAYLPARRAAHIDPIAVLRTD